MEIIANITNNNEDIELSNFSELPDQSQLWVFLINSRADLGTITKFSNSLRSGLMSWMSHSERVSSANLILFKRILIIAGYAPSGISGCGIDSMHRLIYKTLEDSGIRLSPASNISFIGSYNIIASVSRARFKQLIARGNINDQTRVIDTTIRTLGDLRKGGLTPLFPNSWHHKLAKNF